MKSVARVFFQSAHLGSDRGIVLPLRDAPDCFPCVVLAQPSGHRVPASMRSLKPPRASNSNSEITSRRPEKPSILWALTHPSTLSPESTKAIAIWDWDVL